MTAGNRTHLVARLPCGCKWAALTVRDDDTDYVADGRDVKAFRTRASAAGHAVTAERDPTEWKCDRAKAGAPCLVEHVRKLKEATR